MRGLDGKYGRWDKRLRDIPNYTKQKLKIVRNRKATDSDTKEYDDDQDDEEMPKKTGTPKLCDTSERDRRFAPIRTNPEKDAFQIHTDGEISGEISETNIRPSNRNSKQPNKYGSIPYTGNCWG